MGIKGMQGSPIPESYAGPGKESGLWWDPKDANATILDRDMKGEEILTLAGIDWEVEKRPVAFPGPSGNPFGVEYPGYGIFAPDARAIVRKTDDRYYGIVTPTYELFQNHEGADFMARVLDEADGLSAHTAGSLYGGKIVWILAKFDHDIHVKGDGSPIEGYMMGYWGHDGRHALNVLNTQIRVFCGNTASAAIAGARQKIAIRHTKNMGSRVEDARKALDINLQYREAFELTMNSLAAKPIRLSEFKDFTEALWPANPEVENPYATIHKRDALVDLYRTSENLVIIPETYYRAYQATVEFMDHRVEYRDTKKGAATDNRAFSIIEGPTAATKDRALALLLK